MRLHEWLRKTGVKQRHVAHQLGVADCVISLWKAASADPSRLAEERPSLDRIMQLEILSGRAVTVYDWATDEERLALGLDPREDVPQETMPPPALAAVLASSRGRRAL